MYMGNELYICWAIISIFPAETIYLCWWNFNYPHEPYDAKTGLKIPVQAFFWNDIDYKI